MDSRAQAVFAAEIARVVNISPKIQSAFEAVDRTPFIPAGLEKMAYSLDALPIAASQWLSSPITVAKMTSALNPIGSDGALEIGCGSGYQSAVLSKIARRVFAIERIERLLREAKARFKALKISNISARLDDGINGWSAFAPFDRVLFSCDTRDIPSKLFDQLSAGGILVAPIGGEITRFSKNENGRIMEKRLGSCSFVPMLNGVERDREVGHEQSKIGIIAGA